MNQTQFDLSDHPILIQREDGTIRVRGSRISLDTIVVNFERGDSVEDIQDGFPTLSIEQIEGALDWYLSHPVEAKIYLDEQHAAEEKILQELRAHCKDSPIREKLRRLREQQIKN